MVERRRKLATEHAQHRSEECLLLVDVINGLSFPGSGPLVRAAERVAPNIRKLAERARAARVPVVYVNDNFGQWRSDFARTYEQCVRRDQPGRRVTEQLKPEANDYFVLKPQFSGFYCTTLEPLLQHIGAEKLVIVGFAANLCVLFTANDAYMRGFDVVVPSDCTASNSSRLTRAALAHISTALRGRTTSASSLTFKRKSSRH
ncbi:MAG TPA: isochorismatase family cysteine hydrolase [Polyangiales bacterium]|nr:isochorismatase family cysteine hydrolase [Polyangiales bacterium]